MKAPRKTATQSREDGFTLVELLVVIVILGVLASIVVFAVGGLTDKAKTSGTAADRRSLQRAEEAFYANQDARRYATQTELMAGGLLASASTLNSLCLKPGNDGEYFVVSGVPADQAAGDAACATEASARGKTGTFIASTGTPAIP